MHKSPSSQRNWKSRRQQHNLRTCHDTTYDHYDTNTRDFENYPFRNSFEKSRQNIGYTLLAKMRFFWVIFKPPCIEICIIVQSAQITVSHHTQKQC